MDRVYHPEGGASRKTPFEEPIGNDWAIGRHDMPSTWRLTGRFGRVLKFPTWEKAEAKCLELENERNRRKS